MTGQQVIARRGDLERAFGDNRRVIAAFEYQQQTVGEVQQSVTVAVEGTQAIRNATVITLSPNAELQNERVLQFGPGIQPTLTATTLTLGLSVDAVKATGGFAVTLAAAGDSNLGIPTTGFLATREGAETLKNKMLTDAKATLADFADDAAAAAGGVPVTGLYRTGSAVKVRVA